MFLKEGILSCNHWVWSTLIPCSKSGEGYCDNLAPSEQKGVDHARRVMGRAKKPAATLSQDCNPGMVHLQAKKSVFSRYCLICEYNFQNTKEIV